MENNAEMTTSSSSGSGIGKSVHSLISQWEEKAAAAAAAVVVGSSPPLSSQLRPQSRKAKSLANIQVVDDPLLIMSTNEIISESMSSSYFIAATSKNSLLDGPRQISSSIPALHRSTSSSVGELEVEYAGNGEGIISTASQRSLVKALATQFSHLSTSNVSSLTSGKPPRYLPKSTAAKPPTFLQSTSTLSTSTSTSTTTTITPSFRITKLASKRDIANESVDTPNRLPRKPSLILSQLPPSQFQIKADSQSPSLQSTKDNHRLVNTTSNKVTAQRAQRLCDRALQTIFEKPVVDILTCPDMRRLSRTVHRIKDSSGNSLAGSSRNVSNSSL